MTCILIAKVSGVLNSRVEFEQDFIVAFGDGRLKSSLPKALGCPWEELTAFPTLDAALNADEQGALLMDVVAGLDKDNIVVILRATGFEVDEVKQIVHLFVSRVVHLSPRKLLYVEETPISNLESCIPNSATPCNNVTLDVKRDSLSQARLEKTHE